VATRKPVATDTEEIMTGNDDPVRWNESMVDALDEIWGTPKDSQMMLFDADAYDYCPTADEWARFERTEDGDLVTAPPTVLDPSAVLEEVNLIRAVLGLEALVAVPIRGAEPSDPDHCVLARALDCHVDGSALWLPTIAEADLVREALATTGDETLVHLTPQLREVVAKFDEGELEPGDLRVVIPGQLSFPGLAMDAEELALEDVDWSIQSKRRELPIPPPASQISRNPTPRAEDVLPIAA
jgi:hypothetical protein